MLWHLRISVKSVEYFTISLVTEQEEKGKRQLNVIVYKLDKSSENDGPSRKMMILRNVNPFSEISRGHSDYYKCLSLGEKVWQTTTAQDNA